MPMGATQLPADWERGLRRRPLFHEKVLFFVSNETLECSIMSDVPSIQILTAGIARSHQWVCNVKGYTAKFPSAFVFAVMTRHGICAVQLPNHFLPRHIVSLHEHAV